MPHNSPDHIILWISIILIIIGVIVLADVSAPLSQIRFGTPTHFLLHQLIFGLIPALILFLIFYKIPIRIIKKHSYLFFYPVLLANIALFLPPFGEKLKGATRWLNIGPFTFQPSEFLKVALIIYLAYLFSKRNFREMKNFTYFVLLSGITVSILYFQSDLSTLLIISVILLAMYFLSNASLSRLFLIILIAIILLFVMIRFEPYRFNRFLVFLNPQIDPMGIGYQSKQALITVGSGGIFGQGLGMGKQKFGFLPESMSDSVFAVLSEEMGFIGSTILLLLFFTLFWRGFLVFLHSRDKFIKLLSYGISIWIIFQSFLNIGSIIGIFPLAGVPLPFISYGGSHLAAEFIGLGLLLNCSKYCII